MQCILPSAVIHTVLGSKGENKSAPKRIIRATVKIFGTSPSQLSFSHKHEKQRFFPKAHMLRFYFVSYIVEALEFSFFLKHNMQHTPVNIQYVICFVFLFNDYRWRIFWKFEKRKWCSWSVITKPLLFIILTGTPEYRHCLVLNLSVKWCSGYAQKI